MAASRQGERDPPRCGRQGRPAAEAGVKRISMGVALYTRAMEAVKTGAAQLAAGDIASASAGLSFGEVSRVIAAARGAAARG